MATLRYLELILPNGAPAGRLSRLATADGSERQKALQEILVSSYPFLFKGFDLQKATTSQIEERFMQAGASGETVRKCVAFFLAAAKDAKVPVSPFIRPLRVARGIAQRIRRATSTLTPPAERANDVHPDIAYRREEKFRKWSELLLSKFPNFDPAWPDEVKTKWFDAFAKLMKSGEWE